MRAAQDGALISGNSGRGCGAVVPPSPDPEVGAGAITAGGVGATEAVISNSVNERKIAANNKNPMELPRGDIGLCRRAGWRPRGTPRHLRSRAPWRLPAIARADSLSLHLAVQLTHVNARSTRHPEAESNERAIR